MGQCGEKKKRQTAAFKKANPQFYGFEGKSLSSTGYDATDRIPVLGIAYILVDPDRGKSSCLD